MCSGKATVLIFTSLPNQLRFLHEWKMHIEDVESYENLLRAEWESGATQTAVTFSLASDLATGRTPLSLFFPAMSTACHRHAEPNKKKSKMHLFIPFIFFVRLNSPGFHYWFPVGIKADLLSSTKGKNIYIRICISVCLCICIYNFFNVILLMLNC